MDLCNASQELFCVFGDLYVPGVQDVEAANSLLLYYYFFLEKYSHAWLDLKKIIMIIILISLVFSS